MRAFLVCLFVILSNTVSADIARPNTLSDTLDLMLERLVDDFPQARINRADQNIQLNDDMIINPDNIHSVLRNITDGAEREAELDRFIANLVTAMDQSLPEGVVPLDRLYPVVRHATFTRGVPDVYSEPFVGDMVRLYAIDSPDTVAYLTRSDMDAADLTPQAVEQAAIANLDTKLAQATIQQNEDFYFIQADGFYESSMVLNDGLWASMAAQLGGDIAMIVPARDLIVFAPAGNANAVAFLGTIRDDIMQNGTHQLSEYVYLWQNDRWQVLSR